MIQIIFTYYGPEDVSIDDLRSMISTNSCNYDSPNDVWRLPGDVVLRSTNDGRYYEIGSAAEYFCIMAQEYDRDGEPTEGMILGFVPR